MLIEIDPPLTGQDFGLGDQDIRRLIISTRHRGYTLFPVTEWPSYVQVARIIDESILNTLELTPKQVSVIAWGMIFQTFEEAEANAKGFAASGSI